MEKAIKEEDVTLHLAALEGKIHTAKMVLSMGLGDVNQIYFCFRYIDGRQFHLDLTPLHAAVLMGHEEMIRYLISKGGDVNKHLYFRLVMVFWDFFIRGAQSCGSRISEKFWLGNEERQLQRQFVAAKDRFS